MKIRCFSHGQVTTWHGFVHCRGKTTKLRNNIAKQRPPYLPNILIVQYVLNFSMQFGATSMQIAGAQVGLASSLCFSNQFLCKVFLSIVLYSVFSSFCILWHSILIYNIPFHLAVVPILLQPISSANASISTRYN